MTRKQEWRTVMTVAGFLGLAGAASAERAVRFDTVNVKAKAPVSLPGAIREATKDMELSVIEKTKDVQPEVDTVVAQAKVVIGKSVAVQCMGKENARIRVSAKLRCSQDKGNISECEGGQDPEKPSWHRVGVEGMAKYQSNSGGLKSYPVHGDWWVDTVTGKISARLFSESRYPVFYLTNYRESSIRFASTEVAGDGLPWEWALPLTCIIQKFPDSPSPE